MRTRTHCTQMSRKSMWFRDWHQKHYHHLYHHLSAPCSALLRCLDWHYDWDQLDVNPLADHVCGKDSTDPSTQSRLTPSHVSTPTDVVSHPMDSDGELLEHCTWRSVLTTLLSSLSLHHDQPLTYILTMHICMPIRLATSRTLYLNPLTRSIEPYDSYTHDSYLCYRTYRTGEDPRTTFIPFEQAL
jgi:hypothetical protein